MIIYIDADACPKVVKEVIFKAASRLSISVVLVANSHMMIPLSSLFTLIKVEQGDDIADHYIVNHITPGDLVITADIPLAQDVVKKDAIALNPRGEIYNEENIHERLSMRDFMKELRDGGSITGGPSPFAEKDKINFTNSLNKILTRLTKK